MKPILDAAGDTILPADSAQDDDPEAGLPEANGRAEDDPAFVPPLEGPMSDAQAERLQALCEKTGEPFLPGLTYENAELRIEELERQVDG